MPLFGGFAQARNFGKGGAGRPPGFVTPSGSLGTLRGGGGNASALLSAAATTGPGDPPIQSYSIVSGSLPGGLSFNTSTGAITGTANSVASETTYNFTVRATSSAGNIDRAFSITVRLPILAAFTTAGANQTWNVPVGVTDCEVLVIGGGGSGGNIGGGGGGGGVILASAYPVTPGGSVSITVGNGGQRYSGSYPPGLPGENTTFGSLTAYGGGKGGGYSSDRQGTAGGSSGGAAHGPSYPALTAGQPGFSVSGAGPFTNYGNPGGPGATPSGDGTHSGGGGGGAGGAGAGWLTSPWGTGYPYGGSGIYFPQFSSYGTPGGHYAAGGGGGGWSGHIYGSGSGGTGGGGSGGYNGAGSDASGHGSGGGAGGHPAPSGTIGSRGAVFIRY